MPKSFEDEARDRAREAANAIGKGAEYERLSRQALLIGSLYGVLMSYELNDRTMVDYAEIEQTMYTQFGCTEQSLKDIAKEVKRFARLVDGLL